MLMRVAAAFGAPPLVEEDSGKAATGGGHSTHGSIETLVVVLAVITIAGVLAGILARVCGGRHLAGNADHDIEGWVERTCRSCIDGGVPAAHPPDSKDAAPAATPAAAEEPKK